MKTRTKTLATITIAVLLYLMSYVVSSGSDSAVFPFHRNAAKPVFKKIVLLYEVMIFAPNMDAISHALTASKIPHSRAEAFDPLDQNTTIYVTCVTHGDRPLPLHYISYNWEQLTTDKNWSSTLFDRFKGALEVWDYSLLNIAKLATHGITAKHLPMLFYEPTPGHFQISHSPADIALKTVDVVFFGANNDRRQEKLAVIQGLYPDQPSKYSFQNSLHGTDLTKLLHKSKIGINMHYYGGKTILEVHRISEMVLNGLIVLSEHSDDPYLDKHYASIVTFFTLDTLAEKIKQVVGWSGEEYVKETTRRFEAYKIMGGPFLNVFKKTRTVLLSIR